MYRPFKFTRAQREKREKARLSGLAKEIPCKRLTPKEIAAQYTPEKVAALLRRADRPSPGYSPEELGVSDEREP